METKRPVHDIKLGGLALAIWDRSSGNGSTSFNVDVCREQKDSDGKWEQHYDFSPQQESLKDRLEQYALNWLLKYQTVKDLPTK